MEAVSDDSQLPAPLVDWFTTQGWQPRRHQFDMLTAARAGHHALLVAPTGSGKTLSGFLPTLVDLIETPREGLHTLYLSPLKALAVDIKRNLLAPIEAIIDEHVDSIHEICSTYPVGTVVVRRGIRVMTRSYPTAA